jgi:hypothetical protein
MVINEADAQLAAVLNGILFGYNISGIYNHTIGPNDNPKFAINIINPIRIIA